MTGSPKPVASCWCCADVAGAVVAGSNRCGRLLDPFLADDSMAVRGCPALLIFERARTLDSPLLAHREVLLSPRSNRNNDQSYDTMSTIRRSSPLEARSSTLRSAHRRGSTRTTSCRRSSRRWGSESRYSTCCVEARIPLKFSGETGSAGLGLASFFLCVLGRNG